MTGFGNWLNEQMEAAERDLNDRWRERNTEPLPDDDRTPSEVLSDTVAQPDIFSFWIDIAAASKEPNTQYNLLLEQ